MHYSLGNYRSQIQQKIGIVKEKMVTTTGHNEKSIQKLIVILVGHCLPVYEHIKWVKADDDF